jgi:hypothetical protein
MLITQKPSLYHVSVLKDTNKVVGSTYDNFSAIRPGSFIRIENGQVLYPITKTQSIFYSKPFINNKNREIIISDYCGIFIQKGDNIKIFYNRYELDSILSITSAGKGYNEGEIVTISGGVPSVNNIDGQVYPTRLVINIVNPEGGIVSLSKTDSNENGDYINTPVGDLELIGSKNGKNAQIRCQFKIIPSSLSIDRTVREISYQDGKTKIILDYSIDPNITNGNLSLEKWEAHLAYPFIGESRNNVPYEIFKDFTPNLNLPLLLKNSRSNELLYNQGMFLIDAEISSLRKTVEELKSKLT